MYPAWVLGMDMHGLGYVRTDDLVTKKNVSCKGTELRVQNIAHQVEAEASFD